jgi:hypothetical protein
VPKLTISDVKPGAPTISGSSATTRAFNPHWGVAAEFRPTCPDNTGTALLPLLLLLLPRSLCLERSSSAPTTAPSVNTQAISIRDNLCAPEESACEMITAFHTIILVGTRLI